MTGNDDGTGEGEEVIVGLRFYNDGPSIEIIAETDSEKALLGFLVENGERRWKCSPGFNYRPGGAERVVLEVDPKKNLND